MPYTNTPKRIIYLVCKDQEGKTVLLTAKDWRPWLYIKANEEDEKLPPAVWQKKLSSAFQKDCCESVKIVKRCQLVGFTDLQDQTYALCRFSKWPVYNPILKPRFLEHGVKPMLKFFHETGLRSGAWFDAPVNQNDVKYKDLIPRPEDNNPPHLTLMAYDLETSGLDPAKCAIYQICLIFHDTKNGGLVKGGRDPRSVVICTQPTESLNGTNVIVVNNERELLLKTRALIKREDPDIMCGYNLTFDNGFIYARMRLYGGMEDFAELGRVPGTQAAFQEQILSNAAMGTNKRVLWSVSGRIVLDLFLFCKITFTGLPTYKLDYVGQKFVGAGKVDMVFGTILESFSEKGTPELRGRVAAYW